MLSRTLVCFPLIICSNASLSIAFAVEPPTNTQPTATSSTNPWIETSATGDVSVNLYFFWSRKCPHCRNALPFTLALGKKYEWLNINSLELTEHPDHVDQYLAMAKQLGQEARSVPAFLWCGNMVVGYDNPDNMGHYLEQELLKCYHWAKNGVLNKKPKAASVSNQPFVTIPLLGTLSLQEYSLPAYTVILAGLDAFNPCAFFVLLFLLSMLVHAQSRGRMLLVGLIFVAFSALIYFLFMAAWLNVFLIIGQINAITVAAGLLAIAIALVNIKDFFWFKRGVSLSIPDNSKPGLFRRMRSLVNAENLPTMIVATVGLAAFANLYEFLCTAGFPMVYTRILTMERLPGFMYYLYLAFYNVVYVLPLLAIVIIFTATLGVYKLQEKQGRQLKLISGTMMLCLGLVLVTNPDWLTNAFAALGILLVSVLLSLLVNRLAKLKLTTGS